jgi:two-component system osmolarity sensor histidine kinase EnvZ
MHLRPISFFGRTAYTLGITLILFQVCAILVIAYYMMIPVAQRSASDLTDFLLLSARTWAGLPEDERAVYQEELRTQMDLLLSPVPDSLPETQVYQPYVRLLGNALAGHTGQPVRMGMETRDGSSWYWIDFMSGGQRFRAGFSEQRIGIHAPPAIFLILMLGVALTLVTTLFMARRLTQPLSQLAAAAERLGQGKCPEPLPESGPDEVVTLTRTFNQMACQVKALLANRTILLAGIAHDLRTPITRMRLALEMLPPPTDPEIVASMRRAVDNMTHLVAQSLEFSRGIEKNTSQPVELCELIAELVEDARRSGGDIRWQTCSTCVRRVSPTALRRILANLLENAVRYGGGEPIDVACMPTGKHLTVSISDRGPGIPADELEAAFEPFYRVDKSRNSVTGGSGLGLAIARQLADNHGWSLEIRLRDGGGLVALLTV